MSSATYGLLHPRFVFGLNAECKGTNAYFLDASTIIYPAGNAIVMYNMDQKTQHFLHGVEKGRGITAFTVNSIKTHGAVAQLGETPSIVIFDLITNKRRKTMQFKNTTAQEYISLSFTQDNIHLLSLTGPPEYNIYFWRWDRAKMLGQVKATGGVGPVYELSTSPVENAVLCAIGKGCFRFYRYNDGHMKQFGFTRGDSYHFMCHAWLGKGDRLIAGTVDGKLMVFEHGEFRHEIPVVRERDQKTVAETKATVAKLKETQTRAKLATGEGTIEQFDEVRHGGVGARDNGVIGGAKNVDRHQSVSSDAISRQEITYEWKEITALIAFSKGFALAYGSGNVIIYEEQQSFDTPEEHYKPLHRITIPVETAEPEDRVVKSLGMNPHEDLLIATTRNAQLYFFSLATAEIKEPHEMVFEHASCSFHFGPVLCVDVAVRKSLFVTAGSDSFIRIWNYVTYTQECAKEFPEKINCLSFHPTGLFLLAGCSDKVRLYTVLMDDIRELRDFNIRGCHELRFSNGGHLFAAANGNVIQIYNTTFFGNTQNLKGHSNKVRKLKWAQDDNRIYSVGADGAIYEWEINTGDRSADYVERGSNLVDDAFTPDSRMHYALTGQPTRLIKEIQLVDGIVLKELALGLTPYAITMSRSGRFLFAGLENGIVRSFRQPLTYVNEWFDFHMHVSAVTAVAITHDDVCCITCSEDGSIVVWKLTDGDGRVAKEVLYSTEVLVTKSELEEREQVMQELRQKFGELRVDMEYQIRRKEMTFLEETRALKQGFSTKVGDLNANIDALIAAKNEHDADYHVHVQEMAAESKRSLSNLEAHYNAKLIGEYEKYNALQELLESTIRDYEGRLQGLDSDRGAAIDELVEYFEGKIADKNAALETAYNETRGQMTESEEMKRQIEMDADEEILQLMTAYERRLASERDANAKLRGEAGIMRKKFGTMQKEIEEQKGEVQRLLQEGEKMKTVITLTEKEVSTLRKDLVDRDVNVHDKEKVIFDLKKTNNELEKFKYVLDYKVKELKKMIEPKEREIVYLKQQNVDMERELEGIIAARDGLGLQVNELTSKLRITASELQAEKRLRRQLNVLVERIRAHMSRTMALLEDSPELKKMVREMYAKYGEGLQVSRASNAEQEAICELVRQKTHLELSLETLKRKMGKDVTHTRNEQLKIMHENMLLVAEINSLRKELKLARDRILSYESALGVTATSNVNEQAEMRLRLQNAVMEKEEIAVEYGKALAAKEDLIEAQQMEIENLMTKIMKVQDFVQDADAAAVRAGAVPAESVNYLKEVLEPPVHPEAKKDEETKKSTN